MLACLVVCLLARSFVLFFVLLCSNPFCFILFVCLRVYAIACLRACLPASLLACLPVSCFAVSSFVCFLVSVLLGFCVYLRPCVNALMC